MPLLTRSSARLLSIPALAAAGVVAVPALAHATADAPLACGTVVTHDVRLDADLLDCPGAGLVVGASGITIDLAGHMLDGTGSGAGIDNGAGYDDIQITRGVVRDFQFGIHLFETDGGSVERVTADANMIGVIVERSSHTQLDQMTATGNIANGIEVTFSDHITVRRSTAAANGHGGIFDVASIDSTYERNSLSANVAPGLYLWASQGAEAVRNTAVANDSDGILLELTEGATVSRNSTVANSGFGIVAPDSTIDGGRNLAAGNLAGSCTGVTCR